ncbi:MAG: hypothetical protein MJE77_43725 [Proteobacteria bacterium]|nr:hypothetical protein [Pseudomonadota bacterium]
MAGLLLLCACGSSSDGGNSGDVQLRGACEQSDRIGAFRISHHELFSAVSGRVADAVDPVAAREEVYSDGSCALLRQRHPFCDPACEVGHVCGPDATCVRQPENQRAGTIRIDGLLGDVTMEPNAAASYVATALPHPPFEPGARVALVAGGDVTDGFTLYGMGVAPMSVPDTSWVLTPGQELQLAWQAGDVDQARISLSLNIDQHGNTPVTMVCDLDDTGSAVVSSTSVDRLIEFGRSGIGTATISRQTVDSIPLATGCVEMTVSSEVQPMLSVAGG